MEDKLRARSVPALGAALAALAAGLPSPTLAAALSQEDVSMAVYASPDGSSWDELAAGTRAGYFGPHRCLCPVTLMGVVRLTAAGQAKLAQSQSTMTVGFLLGGNCQAAPAGCTSIGQVSFTATQAATPPSFSSSLVFQAVAGGAAVSCSSLTVGVTTLWAVLAQDGTTLSFAPTLDLPVVSKAVAPPTGVTAQPADQGLLVSWTAPPDAALVGGYQVLCLPPPAAPATPGYELCGLTGSTDAGGVNPADTAQLCSGKVAAGATSVRLAGLTNDVPYTVGVVAIDVSGGVSAVSPLVSATPVATTGFYEKYKQAGGAATACALLPAERPSHLGWLILAVALLPLLRRRRRQRRHLRHGPRFVLLAVLVTGGTARAQETGSEQGFERRDERAVERPAAPADQVERAAPVAPPAERDEGAAEPALPSGKTADWVSEPAGSRSDLDDWAREPSPPYQRSDDWAAKDVSSQAGSPPEWAVELGISLYRPAIDSELDGRGQPFADTFSSSRRLLSEGELVRYFSHRYGAWGVGLRAGFYRVTAKAFLADGITRSGDETALRLIPCALSLVYRAVGLPGLRRVPLIPYAKAGLDGVLWTVTNTGGGQSPSGVSLGWHVAGGLMLGLDFLGSGERTGHGIADPLAVFFEWDYAAINGLGLSNALHVGDSTWFAGIMFDI